MRPIIGIILDFQSKKEKDGGYSDYPWYALRMHYARAVSESGGVPFHIPYQHDNLIDYIKLCDGFLFPGGDYDIDPAFYGEQIAPGTVFASDARDSFESKLLKMALTAKIPLLGICAGHQMLNVVCGGTLYQDISRDIVGALDHKHGRGQAEPCHEIKISKDSLLHRIVGAESYVVNSHHHQAVRTVGEGLKATAVASDGVIEAIENDQLPFCLGVEWHPEYLENIHDQKIFKAFVEAAIMYKKSR